MITRLLRALLAVLCVLALVPAWAQSDHAAPTSADESAMARALAAAQAAAIEGPKAIALDNQAVLDLPAEFAFIPKREAAELMHAMGNRTGPDFYGLVFSENMSGFVSIAFDPAGYVKDDDAKDWDADELLQNLKDGTEATNEDRRARGIPEFVVAGWVQKPSYDVGTHRLIWSAEVRDKRPAPDSASGVNYNTYLLGREGFISMNLITDLDVVEAQKPFAHQLLAALNFNEGKRYSDFNESTDTVAAYGLAALVGGVAAKKLGLLAVAAAFLAKFAKVIILGGIGVLAVARKFFRSKEA